MATETIQGYETKIPPLRGPFTQGEFIAWISREAESKKQPVPVANQAAVSAEHLVEDQYWKVYQQQLQAKIDEVGGMIADLKERIADPGMIDYQEILAHKFLLAVNQGKEQAWIEALSLPRQIIDAAQTPGTD